MTSKEFVYELTKPVPEGCLFPFLEREDRIRKLSVDPLFKKWVEKMTKDGSSYTDEWLAYNGKTKLDQELGSRLSWFSALSNSEPVDITKPDEYFPSVAQKFTLNDKGYWLVTVVGQGSISWLMTDEAFQKEFGDI